MIYRHPRYGVRRLIARALPTRPHVLIACMPKTASTFLTLAVSKLPGMSLARLVPTYGRREQELDRTALDRHSLRGYAAQHHTRYSEATGRIIRDFNLRPVVLTRNIFDAVASFRDHFRRDRHTIPMAWLDERIVALPDEGLEEFIADHIAPWYVQFFVSWQHCPQALWIDYEDVRACPESVLADIAKHSGINASSNDILGAIAAARGTAPRFNKGVAGRGDNISPQARNHIERLISRYPDTDFSPIIGIAGRNKANQD